jgi:hypothetical protein
MTSTDWKRRFTAPTIESVTWAELMPHQLGVVSTESGSSQAWTWDLSTGERRLGLYPGGHHANAVAEQIRHVELIVEFLRRHGG